MNNYEFNLLIDEQLVGQGFWGGHNAIEAFEIAVNQGVVYIPDDTSVEVVAVNINTRLMVKFEAGKAL